MLPFSKGGNIDSVVFSAGGGYSNFTAGGPGKISWYYNQPVANQTPVAYLNINGVSYGKGTYTFNKGDVVVSNVGGYWQSYCAYFYIIQ